MADSMSKGKDLELAVEAIERAILKASPVYDENTFRLESRKIIMNGVKHEIDVWVEVEIAKGYNPVFIFECRNREEKADKNDITVFSEKIDASRAQRGFFVAKQFTKYAEAQAERDPRIELLVATELPVERIPVPFDLHFMGLEGTPHANFEARVAGIDDPKNLVTLDIVAVDFVLGGERVALRDYLNEWVNAAMRERHRTFPSNAEGVYNLTAHEQRAFDDGKVFLDGRPISSFDLTVDFKMRVVRPPLISQFEVASRGRSLSLAPARLGEGVEIQVDFVFLDS